MLLGPNEIIMGFWVLTAAELVRVVTAVVRVVTQLGAVHALAVGTAELAISTEPVSEGAAGGQRGQSVRVIPTRSSTTTYHCVCHLTLGRQRYKTKALHATATAN